MKLVVIGVGACGNKAAINIMDKGILPDNCIKLINTTAKDIPTEYRNQENMFYKFSSLDGCGKESSKGKSEMIKSISTRDIILGDMLNTDTQEVVLVTAVEGGTGCGATPVIAQYFIGMGIPVHVYAFIGFQDETRGINNTLRFFKELPSEVILHTIKNEEFLDYTENFSKAELAANDEFAKQIEILTGRKYISSSQNIDDTDMYKVSTVSGYMNIQHISLNGCKNTELFNKAVQESFDNLKCLDFDKSAKKVAVFINGDNKIKESIDDRFEIIKRYTGEPAELFRHVQHTDADYYIDIIISGMNLPREEIVKLNMKYMDMKSKSTNKIDTLDDLFNDMDLEDEETEMNSVLDKENADILFMKKYGTQYNKVIVDDK